MQSHFRNIFQIIGTNHTSKVWIIFTNQVVKSREFTVHALLTIFRRKLGCCKKQPAV